jgi:hypothetical protein
VGHVGEEETLQVSPPSVPDGGVKSLWFTWAPVLSSLCVVAAALYAAWTPFHSKLTWLVFVQDDCFYYLKVAQNLATGHGSTFNGIFATNGYHPLWLLLLTGVCLIFGQSAFFPFIALTVFVSILATYFAARAILKQTGVAPLTVNALAALVAAFSMPMFFTGMEVLLTIPLGLYFVSLCLSADPGRHRFWHALGLGSVISAMVLSRLDSALLVVLLLAALLLSRRLRSQIRQQHVLGIALGLIPLALYVASNQVFFHTWMPVSGMAKQMRWHHYPSRQVWHSFLIGPVRHYGSLLPIVLAFPLFFRQFRQMSDKERVVYSAVLLWPFTYILLLSCLSDWMLWMWYFYPFRIVLCIALVLIFRERHVNRLAWKPVIMGLLISIAAMKLFTARWTPGDMPEMVEIGRRVTAFSLTHPGTYAMGDRAGSVGFLMPYPLVQTEGLVMDRSYLESVRREGSLRSELLARGVRYYIATEDGPLQKCFHASEPSQAGPDSPHLRDIFCEAPLANFEQGGMTTAIYDLLPIGVQKNAGREADSSNRGSK